MPDFHFSCLDSFSSLVALSCCVFAVQCFETRKNLRELGKIRGNPSYRLFKLSFFYINSLALISSYLIMLIDYREDILGE
ncbi:hypothetical protein SDJN03_12015, partial [Cucurbita argyrosperma subsp. sororia]